MIDFLKALSQILAGTTFIVWLVFFALSVLSNRRWHRDRTKFASEMKELEDDLRVLARRRITFDVLVDLVEKTGTPSEKMAVSVVFNMLLRDYEKSRPEILDKIDN